MKAALIIPRLTGDVAENLVHIEQMADGAASSGAKLLVLPEAVLTGLVNRDDPAHDIKLGQTIPGPATDRLGVLCSRHRCWLAFGMLERQETCLYDSAVLLKSDGSIGLTYRRAHPGWHGKKADPRIYRQGVDMPTLCTPFGKAAFLLCGDLFDDAIIARFCGLAADWMLFPFARCFSDGSVDQARWDSEELPAYAKRITMTKTTALMVNYLADASLPGDNSFGGAFVISCGGDIVARHPLGEEGILIVDLEAQRGSNKVGRAYG